jgi:hypothetical protein
MLGVFAEFERAIIVERVRAGIARAKAQGTHCGRPFIKAETEQAIRAALATGKGIRKVARECASASARCRGSRARRRNGRTARRGWGCLALRRATATRPTPPPPNLNGDGSHIPPLADQSHLSHSFPECPHPGHSPPQPYGKRRGVALGVRAAKRGIAEAGVIAHPHCGLRRTPVSHQGFRPWRPGAWIRDGGAHGRIVGYQPTFCR